MRGLDMVGASRVRLNWESVDTSLFGTELPVTMGVPLALAQ